MTDPVNMWKQDMVSMWKQEPPSPVTASVKEEDMEAYWLAVIGYNAAAAHSEIAHKDPGEAKRLLAEVLNRYFRSSVVEPGERDILKRAMR